MVEFVGCVKKVMSHDEERMVPNNSNERFIRNLIGIRHLQAATIE